MVRATLLQKIRSPPRAKRREKKVATNKTSPVSGSSMRSSSRKWATLTTNTERNRSSYCRRKARSTLSA
jgi:hypothetical protein